MSGNKEEHGRGGSYALMFVGGYQRECLCGLSFIGTAEESFAQREAHIAETRELTHDEAMATVVLKSLGMPAITADEARRR